MHSKQPLPVETSGHRGAHAPAGSGALAALLWLGVSCTAWADAAGDVAKLEAQCEAAREAKIRPLREAEIAKCKADEHNDPAYCERYWRDYGNARRLPNGNMSPRLFDDLPACTAAMNARAALTRDGR